MLVADPPATSPHLRHSGRKPLHPKTNILTNNQSYYPPPPNNKSTPLKCHKPPIKAAVIDADSNKENIVPLVESIDASLAEELTAVKRKLERLRIDSDKTRELLQERDRVLEVQMTELLHRGDFQKELEIEVDRLYRLKHLQQASMRMSPIRSLREKEMEKRSKEPQTVVGEKSGESKEEMMDESSSTEDSPTSSLASSSASTSASVTKSTATTTKIMLPVSFRLSFESGSIDKRL